MIRRRFLQEWPLAAFTLALQIACGISIATTVTYASHSPAQSAALRALGSAVFPVVFAGLLLSLMHLGRPLSAWRALSNCFQSRLSVEVLLSTVFAVSALAYSLGWWTGTPVFRLYTGAIASVLGIVAVVASAAVYQVGARPIWNSGSVMTSFVGSTVMVAGLALSVCRTLPRLGTTAVLAGSAILLLSGAWMWSTLSCPLHDANWLRIWFTGYLLLVISAPLLMIYLPANSSVFNGVAFACCTYAPAMIAGRMLMLALAELEVRF